MKLALWQQYSSNHSANFMIVGRFESAEWAATVAEEVRAMLREISAWWAEYEADDDMAAAENRLRRKADGMTPPEQRYKAEYQIEQWGRTSHHMPVIDWLQSSRAPESVRLFQNMVIISPDMDTWAGPKPFDEILRKLDGKVAVDCEQYDTYLAMNLTCLAPDEGTAHKLVSNAIIRQVDTRTIFQLAKGFYPTRGRIYADGHRIVLEHYQLHGSHYEPNKPPVLFEEALTSILDYFRGQGCTDIEYDFLEVPYP